MKQLKYIYCYWRVFRWSKKIDVPEGWKELSPKQFIAAAKLYNCEYSVDRFLRDFYGFPRLIVSKLSSYDKYKLIELVEFVRDARIPFSDFFLDKIPGTKLQAPGAKLSGMCLQQFMTVDTYFSKYVLDQSKDHYLNLFIAALYMKDNERYVLTSNDKKCVALDIDSRVNEVAKIDKEIKYAIFLNFIMIKSWLARAYIHLFPESDSDNKSNNKINRSVDWLSIFDCFVGDHIPDMDKYQAMPVTDALRIMNRRIKEAIKNGNN